MKVKIISNQEKSKDVLEKNIKKIKAMLIYKTIMEQKVSNQIKKTLLVELSKKDGFGE